MKVSEFIKLVEGHYTSQWPTASGLGAIDLTVSYNGSPLALSTSNMRAGTPNDPDMDGVEDGSVYVVIPIKLHVVTAAGSMGHRRKCPAD